MGDEGRPWRDRVLGAGAVVVLLGAAVAFRQRSLYFQVPAYAVLIGLLGGQTVAKLTHRSTPFDSTHGHVGFCLAAVLMVLSGGLQAVDPQPDTAAATRVLGGFACLAGVVMLVAEGLDFRPWRDRMAEDDDAGPWWS